MTQESTAAPGSVEPARRMTLSHVLELLLARSASDRSSVTLTRNAKGETQIAYSKAVELYDKARRQYPMSTGQVGASS
jgi:hypothetical protein